MDILLLCPTDEQCRCERSEKKTILSYFDVTFDGKERLLIYYITQHQTS